LSQDRLNKLVHHPIHNYELELLHALVVQVYDVVHFHIIAVKVLKEIFHPPDHDLMIAPTKLNFGEKRRL
jgi:hypothetical protein